MYYAVDGKVGRHDRLYSGRQGTRIVVDSGEVQPVETYIRRKYVCMEGRLWV